MDQLESVGTTPSHIAVSDRADAHRSSSDNPKSGRRARHGVSTTGCPPLVGMNPVEKPGPVALPLLAKNSESGLEATIPGISEPREDLEPYQHVVIVVRRVVEPEPRSVPSPLLEELPLEIELRPSRDRPLH